MGRRKINIEQNTAHSLRLKTTTGAMRSLILFTFCSLICLAAAGNKTTRQRCTTNDECQSGKCCPGKAVKKCGECCSNADCTNDGEACIMKTCRAKKADGKICRRNDQCANGCCNDRKCAAAFNCMTL